MTFTLCARQLHNNNNSVRVFRRKMRGISFSSKWREHLGEDGFGVFMLPSEAQALTIEPIAFELRWRRQLADRRKKRSPLQGITEKGRNWGMPDQRCGALSGIHSEEIIFWKEDLSKRRLLLDGVASNKLVFPPRFQFAINLMRSRQWSHLRGLSKLCCRRNESRSFWVPFELNGHLVESKHHGTWPCYFAYTLKSGQIPPALFNIIESLTLGSRVQTTSYMPIWYIF